MGKKSHEAAAVSFIELLEIMDRLRAECPWDKKQNNQTLRTLTIEEVFELSESILEENDQEISKELGDILLHLVFYAKIGSEKSAFTMKDVIDQLNEKLIFRHPHIYGDTAVNDEEEVKQNWEKLKLKEGRKSVLEGVPKSLTGLLKAYRLQDKAAGVGFDWKHKEDVWEKVQEELHEWKEAIDENDGNQMEEELGDLLFAMVNYARFLKINPEDALEKSNLKFIRRFQFVEKRAREENKPLDSLELEEMEGYYQEAKAGERKSQKKS